MSDQPLVSIIIPTYNRAYLIGETLDSIVAQTYENWECIIVDDGSSDNTDEVVGDYVNKDSRFKYYHRPEEHLPGGNGARNYGFKMSQGDFIQWFDSDDLMDENLLFEQIENMISFNVVISICLYDRYDENFSKITVKSVEYSAKNSLYYDYIMKVFSFNLQTTLFSRSYLQNYKLNEKLFKSQEYEFLQRILRELGDNYSVLNKSLVKIRRHNNSITGMLTDRKLKSLLEVSVIVLKQLPKNTPHKIKRKLFCLHTKNLKIAYLNKQTILFFVYLFSVPKGFLYYKWLFSLLYLLFFLTSKGDMKYKKIQKSILRE
jgi:glycosyltransferase involved in cell wall biosynthesis